MCLFFTTSASSVSVWEFFRFSVCISLTYRWTPLSDGDRGGGDSRIHSGGDYHEGLRIRVLVRNLASPHRTRSSTSSKTSEALGNALGVTAANVNISPHAASPRRALHEPVAICHGTNTHQQWTTDFCGSDAPPPRGSRWRHRTSCDWHSGLDYLGELLDSNSTPGQRYWALVYHLLKPGNLPASTPWTQIMCEKEAHVTHGTARSTLPLQHGTCDSHVLGRRYTD